MPPVEIPTLDRFQPVNTPSTGRLDVQTPDFQQAVASQDKAFSNVISTGVDASEKYDLLLREKQLQSMDVEATNLNNQYEVGYKSKLAEIGKMTGNTADAYQGLQEYKQKLKGDLTDQLANRPPEVQQMFASKVAQTDARLYSDEAVQQHTQNFVYQQQTNKDTVKLRQDSMLNNAQLLDMKDPKSFLKFKSQVDDIVNINSQNALANGLATKDENGNIKSLSPQTLVQIKNDVGDGIINAVKVLNNAGKAKEARKLISDYDSYLNADDKAKLLSDNEDASVRNQALDFVSKMKTPSDPAEVNANKDISEAVKQKAREFIDTNNRYQEHAIEQKGKAAYIVLYNKFKQQSDSKQPMMTTAQMRDDPTFKAAKDFLTPAQQKALESIVKAPDESDPKALENVRKAWMNGDFAGQSPADFQQMISQLSEKDRTPYQNLWNQVNRPAGKNSLTEAQQRQRMTSITGMAVKDMQLYGGFPKNGNPDTWSDTDKAKYGKFMDGLLEYSQKNIPADMIEPAAQKSQVREYIRDFMQQNPNVAPHWWSSARKQAIPESLASKVQIPNSPMKSNEVDTLGPKSISQPATNTSGKINARNLTTDQFKYWKDQYLKANPGLVDVPDDPEVFSAWINKQGRK